MTKKKKICKMSIAEIGRQENHVQRDKEGKEQGKSRREKKEQWNVQLTKGFSKN